MEANNYQKILKVAQELVQLQGFNAFSYRDLSAAVGIKTSSIHYYFPTKEALGEILVKEYRENFQKELTKIESSAEGNFEKLEAYVSLFVSTLRDNGKICLCGMLASDFQTLPENIRIQVRLFFEENEKWLTRVLQKGKELNDFGFNGHADEVAATFLATLEGAMLVSRVYQDNSRLSRIVDSWLSEIVRP